MRAEVLTRESCVCASPCQSRRVRRVLFSAVILFVAVPAGAAPDASYGLELEGIGKVGVVKSIEGGDEARPLTTTFGDVPAGLSSLVAGFADGKSIATKLTLTNGVTIKRAREARLVRVHLPSIGAGGASDVALVFSASPLTPSPWLSPKNVVLPAPGKKIADARVDAGQGIRVARLSAIEITQTSGKAATNEITIEGEPGSLPAISAWSKSKAVRSLSIDYVDPDVKTLIRIRLDGCTPKSFVPTPATLTLACTGVRS